jgi:phosphoglycerate kinase
MFYPESALPNWNIINKNIFLRADLNVPIDNKVIVDDYRLQAIIPTITMILEKGGRIILVTHLGRPKNPSPELSTALLIPWFINQGHDITFAATIHDAYLLFQQTTSRIILLENIRFFPGEKKASTEFAKELASLADYYINDAFGSLHLQDTSIELVPQQFNKSHKTIGLLVQKELHALSKLLHTPKKPFTLIIGGKKLRDKIPVIQHLLDKIDTIMLCPAIVFTFLDALKQPVGISLTDNTLHQVCLDILHSATQKKTTVLFPKDYLIATNSISGPLSTVSYNNHFPYNGMGISIGPKTASAWQQIIHNSSTIVYIGLMGMIQRKQTLDGVQSIFNAMAKSSGQSIIGGGDSVAAARILNISTSIDFCSTGGSATLAYLAGKELPGLKNIF